MNRTSRRFTTLGAAAALLFAWSCSDEGVIYLTNVDQEPTGTNCADGGQQLNFGPDSDGDGTLADGEVTATAYVCNGAASRGATVTSAAIPVGDPTCPAGGFALTIGVDQDGNGVVEGAEGVVRTVCNSEPGANGNAGPQGAVGPTGPGGGVGPQGANGNQGGPPLHR